MGLLPDRLPPVVLSSQADVDNELHEWASLWEAESTVEPLPPGRLPGTTQRLTPEILTAAALTFPADTGLGGDNFSPRAVARLPNARLDQLAQLLMRCEEVGAWPSVWALVQIVLLEKPDGGRRPIGLFPAVIRLWMRARATEVRQWQEDHDHHLFYGAAGRSAVRAAWQSAFAAERASYGEEEFASALLDLMKAFETVPHAKLIELARQHDYPLETLRLALAAYRLPRILCIDGIASQLTAASRGITAGSGHATTELRLLLLGLVEQLADCIRQSNNQLQASVYVDDVCVEAAGNRADGSAARDVASAVEMVKH